MHRHIITAIKAATRQKQIPLNTSLSLEVPSEDDSSDWNMSDILHTDEAADPEELVLRREDSKLLHEILHRLLSDFEWREAGGASIDELVRGERPQQRRPAPTVGHTAS